MSKWKSFLAVIVTSAVLLSLAACGGETGGNVDTSTPNPTKSTSTATAEPDPEETNTLWTKYDPPIEMHFATSLDANSAESIAIEKAFGETLEDNRWIRYYEDELGIKVVYDMVEPVDYDQAILLAMTSGDLPDYFNISNYSHMQDMVEADILTEMGPLYDKYASPLLKQITESEGDTVFMSGLFDGKLYGLPAKMPSTNAYTHLFVRQDWLDKLNLERPTTMDELSEVAHAFKTQDPDGNDVDDTIGMAMDNNFLYQSAGIFWAFGAYPNGDSIWFERDSKLQFANIQPEMKDGISWLKMMYDRELISHEFGSYDYAKGYEEPIMNGKCGLMYGKHWNAYVLGQYMTEYENSKWVSLPLPVGTVDKIKIPANVEVGGFMVAKKEAEHPEALVYMANAYVDKLFGENNDFDHFFADGDVAGIWSKGPLNMLDPMVDLQAYRDIVAADKAGTLDQLTGAGRGFYQSYKAGSIYYWIMFGAGDSSFRFVDQTYPDQIIWNGFVGAPTPTMAERWSSMNEMLITSYTNMITDQEDIIGFDKIVEQWYSMGGTQVEQEVNQRVKN